jgi:ADP-ribose pyrophosphatase YjhB (NUDIX family)
MKDNFETGSQNLSHQLAVNAFLIERDKFLLLERASAPLIWGPPGGRLHRNEDPITGLKREVREETHLVVEVLNPVITWFGKFQDTQLLSIDYLCIPTGGDIRISREHKRFRWLSIEELEMGKEIYLSSPQGFRLSDFRFAWRVYLFRNARFSELIAISST